MDGSLGLIARMPALQVDWQTLVSVNLPTLLLVIVAVPLALVGYIVGADVLVRRRHPRLPHGRHHRAKFLRPTWQHVRRTGQLHEAPYRRWHLDCAEEQPFVVASLPGLGADIW